MGRIEKIGQHKGTIKAHKETGIQSQREEPTVVAQ
jgi:hypothetical protein